VEKKVGKMFEDIFRIGSFYRNRFLAGKVAITDHLIYMDILNAQRAIILKNY